MHYVYVLEDSTTKRLYVGRTNDLKRRLQEHLQGKTYTISRMSNLKLIFYEAFGAKEDSIRREKYFKTSKGKKSLKQIIRESII